MSGSTKEMIQQALDEYVDSQTKALKELNHSIHDHPELAYKEHHAHNAICDFLEQLGIAVTRHAYGLSTAFEATSGSHGRCINFNAEYDALPGIGHACGHNLIATASVTGFIALSYVTQKFGLPGRAQLLGTPAEEDGGGKIDLLEAGAYEKANVSLMMHPMAESEFLKLGARGIAGRTSIACYDVIGAYEGVSAHASAAPWEGVNALDAVVAAYNNISMLRQQIQPTDRIHGAILNAPDITNAIPEKVQTKYTIRSPTIQGAKALGQRVRQCLEAGALATGCKIQIEETKAYANLVVNQPLCEEFRDHSVAQGEKMLVADDEPMSGSTDQGNVSHALPSLHALIGIPAAAQNHTHEFTAAVATEESFQRTLKSGKSMAMTGWALLTDEHLYTRVIQDFEKNQGSQ
ncbi:hypothetical protein N7474_003705 [Penicillium riverlandense]|uniref:uncharacterized protein n=1 Tax=Penicillium riverlandense TaxID=1903569 RepID=UPI002547AD9C|nr:uncharacterized protein N7474_003705 [Penicillium riverlandense]KAJ5818114.1 hypothetical protein N7474_003705 [Penicillium riverlandense]